MSDLNINKQGRSTVNGGLLANIPNLFTLLNLFFGCLAIVACMQSGLVLYDTGDALQSIVIPESIVWASVFIGAAAVIDFLDGFVARLLNAPSDMGKQLDSLADVVSFGVAPAMIVFQFLRLSIANQKNGLDVLSIWAIPAFIIACAGAYRLARFNIDTKQSEGFSGVPVPAIGMFIAGFPLIFWYTNIADVRVLLQNKWFWYAVIFISSYLMVSTLPMLSLKFKNVSVKSLLPFIIIAVISIISIFVLGWITVSVTFIAYVIISLIFNKKNKPDVI